MLKAALLCSDVNADVLDDGKQIVELKFNAGKLVGLLVTSLVSAGVGLACGLIKR